jgi:glutathione S-transferase
VGTLLIVKGAKRSPFARKVIITLEEKRVPYEIGNVIPFP